MSPREEEPLSNTRAIDQGEPTLLQEEGPQLR